MLARVRTVEGDAVTLHRTYLHDGRKLAAPDAKKVLCAGFSGAAVRLGEATDELALTEGIETGIAIMLSTSKPVWAALSAGNPGRSCSLRRSAGLHLRRQRRRWRLHGPGDAYALARRLMREDANGVQRSVRVFVPKNPSTDWADVWQQRQLTTSKRAA